MIIWDLGYFHALKSFVVAVNKAWRILENPETKAKCMDVVEEAKAKTDQTVSTSRGFYFDLYESFRCDEYLDCREEEEAAERRETDGRR